MTRQAGALIGLTAVVSFLLGLVAAGTRAPASAGGAVIRPHVDVSSTRASDVAAAPAGSALPASSGPAVDFASVAARVNSAVVNIEAASRGSDRQSGGYGYATELAVRDVTDIGLRPAVRGSELRSVSQDQSPLGIKVRDLDSDVASHLHIPESVEGVLVADVDAAGPAHLAQVHTSDVILEINRRPVRSLAHYRSFVAGLKPGDSVALLVFDRTTAKRSILTVLIDPAP